MKESIRRSSIEAYAWFNKSTPICYEASRCCVNGKLNSDYDAQLLHIKNRIKVGHESVIEHSNFVVAMLVPDIHLADLAEVLSCCQYLYSNTERRVIKGIIKKKMTDKTAKNEYNATLVNIAGSIRGWKHIYRTIKNIDSNRVLMLITKLIVLNIPKEYFTDFIEDGILSETLFYPQDEQTAKTDREYEHSDLDPNGEFIDIINIDSISNLYENIGEDFLINTAGYELANCLTITVDFIGMSRSTTHQLVRHRNAITQSSQRYIDFSKPGALKINNPFDDYGDDEVGKNQVFDINFYDHDFKLTAEELLSCLGDIYIQLKEQNVKNEIARDFGPQAMDAGHVYMTFTLTHLFKFLELRTDLHAQAKIRKYANILYDVIINKNKDYFGNLLTKDDENHFVGLYPVYKILDINKNSSEESQDEDLSETIPNSENLIYVNTGSDKSINIEKINENDIPIGTSKNIDV